MSEEVKSNLFLGALEKIRFYFIKKKKELSLIEGKYVKMPSNVLAHEVVKLQGELRGMEKALEILESFQGQEELNLTGRGAGFH